MASACRLEAHRLLEPGVDESAVSIFFRDATTGQRDVRRRPLRGPRAAAATAAGSLDFNDAYNPACAFSPYYNCPIPTRANLLKVAIRAGEKDSHYAH